MSVIDQIFEKAKSNPQKVVFPEALNEKMMQAAFEAGSEGYIYPILVGNKAEIEQAIQERGYDLSVFTVVDMEDEEYRKRLIEKYRLN